MVVLHFKLLAINRFLHEFLEVLSDIKDENSLNLHDELEGINGYINAQEQHATTCCDVVTGNFCETFNFPRIWKQ